MLTFEKQPHHGLEDYKVERLFKQGKYPDITDVALGDVISKCWEGGFSSAAEVAEAIAPRVPGHGAADNV
ncbi:hypothetical protein VTK26DRAFT_6337 [Humicola hyalothermophila]